MELKIDNNQNTNYYEKKLIYRVLLAAGRKTP